MSAGAFARPWVSPAPQLADGVEGNLAPAFGPGHEAGEGGEDVPDRPAGFAGSLQLDYELGDVIDGDRLCWAAAEAGAQIEAEIRLVALIGAFGDS